MKVSICSYVFFDLHTDLRDAFRELAFMIVSLYLKNKTKPEVFLLVSA